MDNTILETLEHSIKTNDINASYFRKKEYIVYSSDYHEQYLEGKFCYCLFQLYCFYDLSIEEIYTLITDMSRKYNKNDLSMLTYSDFVDYAQVHRFHDRKETYLKTSDKYQSKIQRKENVISENITHITDDYDSTIKVIDCLNQDIEDICNNEDISPEKRLGLFNQYSKVSIRLNEKRFGLLSKIREEVL